MKYIPDKLWNQIEKLIPKKINRVGRPETDNRKALSGIIYVLYTGAQWNMLPKEYGCHTTVHGKFMKWCKMGVFKKMIAQARKHYCRKNGKNNWYAFDTLLKKAPFAKNGGKNPTDRSKRGIKQAILVDRKGAPLFVDIAPANKHDSKLMEPAIEQLNRSKNIRIIAADSAFDVKKLYSFCKEKNVALIASINPRKKKNIHKFNVPYRWIVERTFGILSWFRGIKICWAKTFHASLAFLQIACSIRLFKMSGIFG